MINIGFVGTGLMGLPMAKNILKSGLKLSAFNRTINKAEPLKEFCAEISNTLSEVVNDKDCIITMLTDDSAVDAIMSNSDFLDNLKSGSTVIHMTTEKPTNETKIFNNFVITILVILLSALLFGSTSISFKYFVCIPC